MEKDKYSSQKKYLSEHKKQLRVWVDTEKFEQFKEIVEKNNTSIHSLINNFIDEYITKN